MRVLHLCFICDVRAVVNIGLMSKQNQQSFYAVGVGRKVGVYNTWNECKSQIDGIKNPKFKKFNNLIEAEEFVNLWTNKIKLTNKLINDDKLRSSALDVETAQKGLPRTSDTGRAQAEDVGSCKRGIECEGLNIRGLQEKIFGCEKRIDIYTNKLNDVLSGFKEMKNEFGHITHVLRQISGSQKRKLGKTNEPEPGPSKEKPIPNPPAGYSNNETSDAFNPNTSQVVKIEDFDLTEGGESQGPAKRKKLASDKDTDNEKPGENNKQVSDERGELTFLKDEDGYVSVYTDGCCLGNGNMNAKAGIGIWFGENHPLNVGEPYKGVTPTNNNAEIQAARVAIEIALKAKISKLKIITDSQFLINSVTEWIPKWKLNNWTSSTNKSIVNRVELEKLDKVMSLLSVRWEKVVGHSGIRGNEAADMLANKGAETYAKM